MSQSDVLVVPTYHQSSRTARNWLDEDGDGAEGCAAIVEGDPDRGASPASTRPLAPHGPRQSVREPRIPQGAEGHRRRTEHEPNGRLLEPNGDNGVAESFFGTLRSELLDHENYATRAAACAAVEDIDHFYNPHRRHSSIGYLSPMGYELRLLSVSKAA